MRPATTANQLLATSGGGGLPLCLSGILNLAQVRCSSRDQRVILRRQVKQDSSRETENSGALEDYMDSRLCETEGHELMDEVSGRDDNLQERPRLAFTLEMAEHERRREAIRKRRSNRGITSNFVHERRALTERNTGQVHNIINALMQDPSFRDEFDRGLHHRTCAKAA